MSTSSNVQSCFPQNRNKLTLFVHLSTNKRSSPNPLLPARFSIQTRKELEAPLLYNTLIGRTILCLQAFWNPLGVCNTSYSTVFLKVCRSSTLHDGILVVYIRPSEEKKTKTKEIKEKKGRTNWEEGKEETDYNTAANPMFFLSLIEHTLRLPPHLLSRELDEAIRGELETLFLDKVIPNLGLCVSVYDIRSIDGGFIFAGDGASTYTVEFRLIMFRPFVGEILSGKVKASNANGLKLSLGFFKDILVPVHLLPNPSTFDEYGRWTWKFGEAELTIEIDEEIRFRIHSVTYPPIPVEQETCAEEFAPMLITASIDYDGLGPISWWV